MKFLGIDIGQIQKNLGIDTLPESPTLKHEIFKKGEEHVAVFVFFDTDTNVCFWNRDGEISFGFTDLTSKGALLYHGLLPGDFTHRETQTTASEFYTWYTEAFKIMIKGVKSLAC